MQGRESLEFCKQNLMNDSGQRSDDQNINSTLKARLKRFQAAVVLEALHVTVWKQNYKYFAHVLKFWEKLSLNVVDKLIW